MSRRVVGVMSFAAALLLSTSPVFASDNPTGGNVAIADQVATSVNNVAPTNVDNHRLALASAGGSLKASGLTIIATVPTISTGMVRLASADSTGQSLSVGLPVAGRQEKAVVASDGTVTFGSARPSYAVAIQAFQQGVRIHVVLRSRAAVSQYSYPVAVPAGGQLVALADGGLNVLGPHHTLIGGFAAPWARDRNGVEVPTHFEIRSNTVVQVVDHTLGNFTYPVVADPWLGINLIDHATWVYHSGFGWTFEVTPTWWARANAGGYFIGVADWDELYGRYKNRGLNTNLNGMRDQLICHQQVVAIRDPGKPTWNIDEWRPDVGYLQTVNASCNPGGPTFFD